MYVIKPIQNHNIQTGLFYQTGLVPYLTNATLKYCSIQKVLPIIFIQLT